MEINKTGTGGGGHSSQDKNKTKINLNGQQNWTHKKLELLNFDKSTRRLCVSTYLSWPLESRDRDIAHTALHVTRSVPHICMRAVSAVLNLSNYNDG